MSDEEYYELYKKLKPAMDFDDQNRPYMGGSIKVIDPNNCAKFEVKCEYAGFSRSVAVPLDSRDYVRMLADDLDHAIKHYELAINNYKLRQVIERLKTGILPDGTHVEGRVWEYVCEETRGLL